MPSSVVWTVGDVIGLVIAVPVVVYFGGVLFYAWRYKRREEEKRGE